MLTDGLRKLLYRLLPRPKAIRASQFRCADVKRVIVLSKGANPTFSYYLEERLKQLSVPTAVFDLGHPVGGFEAAGTFVIICRYVRPRQLWWLYRNRNRLAGAALFVDDDLNATIVDHHADLSYRLYLFALGVAPLTVLNRALTHVWASTRVLADRLRTPHRLDPYPPLAAWKGSDQAPAAGPQLLVVYHATGNHLAEHMFLQPIMEEVMRRHPHLKFEVSAKGRAAAIWERADIDKSRIKVLATRPWATYLKETSTHLADIALVPLLGGATSDARSDTKRIDVCRMNAAAIFSAGTIYERCSVTGELLVGNEAGKWVDAIVRLVESSDLRGAARQATARSIEKMITCALPALPGLACHIVSEGAA